MAITRLVKNQNHPYTMVSKTLAEDERLSWKAKGIMLYLLGKPNDWQFYVTEIQNHATDGRDGTASGVQELEEYGYITRRTVRDDGGKFVGMEWHVDENPPKYANAFKKSKTVETGNGKAGTGESRTTNNDNTNNDNTNIKDAGEPAIEDYFENRPKVSKGKELQKPDLPDPSLGLVGAMAQFQEREQGREIENAILDYPSDVQDTVLAFCKTFHMPAPTKQSKKFGLWIKQARAINNDLAGTGLQPDEVMRELHYIWKTPPYKNIDRKEYEGQYKIYGIQSIQTTIWEAVTNLVTGNPARKTQTYIDPDGNKIEREL